MFINAARRPASATHRPGPAAARSESSAPRPDAPKGRLGVPWSTVLPLALVMAYADGFWMTTVRGAVGAIERTQSPFASWWRESTLVLPVFIVAVLGALTLALRRFGPVHRKPITGFVTALLVVSAGTVAGIAELVASSAYDYHLESNQLQMMNSMHSLCAGGCLAQEQQATLGAQITAVRYASGLILVTNLVLVGWVLAVKGGRLKVATIRATPSGAIDTPRGSRVGNVHLLLVAGLLGSAAIHTAVTPDHLSEWPAAGVFFILLTAAEVAIAVAVLFAPRQRTVLLTAAVISLGPLALWLYSRTAGLPFGPAAGIPEAVSLPDCAASALEIGALLAALVLFRSTGRLQQHPRASAHVRSLTVTAMIAFTVIGLAGTAPNYFDNSGTSAVINVSH